MSGAKGRDGASDLACAPQVALPADWLDLIWYLCLDQFCQKR